jgi:hypothetical protein
MVRVPHFVAKKKATGYDRVRRTPFVRLRDRAEITWYIFDI